MLPALVLRVPVALTVQESALLKGRVRASVTGVIPVAPPEVVSVSLPSVQVAVQAVRGVLVGAVCHAHADADRGRALIDSITVQVASVVDVLDALQKPAVLALAAVTPAVIAPAVSNPVKAA